MIEFTKMHGCGNDYIYFYGNVENPAELAIKQSNRHTGIGGDGIVLILPSHVADAKMQMYNADGSEGNMCGNAIRCVAKYLYDNKLVPHKKITIETKSGIKNLTLSIKDKICKSVTVDMGTPKIFSIGFVTHISMGNPHAVVFCDDINTISTEKIGRFFEKNPYFAGGINTEFVQIIGKTRLKMRVWERGSGETMACGTGACASVVAAILHGHCEKNTDIVVELLGGELTIKYTGETVLMTGSAETVFRGQL
jgi:diaminopimelate epimerase